MSSPTRRRLYSPYSLLPGLLASLGVILGSCIKNDIPYPRIPQMILSIAAEGQLKEAYIDSIAFEVDLYLEEQTDIRKVHFDEFTVSPGATSSVNLLEGSYDLSAPLFLTLSLYQEYDWEIIAHQTITRYFTVTGEIGESVIDPVAHRVVVNVPEGTDLKNLDLTAIKLGPEGITTMTPEILPGPLDLSYPLRVEVTAHGRTEIWTIYAEVLETVVSTSSVDAWSKVVWAYGVGPADVANGFEYRRTDSSEWIAVPQKDVIQDQGNFSACIKHLEPLTEYAVRAISGADIGNEIKVTTQATADIPDGDFEQWSQTSEGMWQPWAEGSAPYWDTGNQGSWKMRTNLTTPSDHVPPGLGGKSARCETKFVSFLGIGKLGSGSIFTGNYLRTDGTDGVLAFGRPWTLRPTRLKGYYQYNAAIIDRTTDAYQSLKGRPDTCHIYVALADWSAPFEIRTKASDRQLFDRNMTSVIAYGELVVSAEMTAYKPFEIELKYKDTGRIPTYLQITCTSSKLGDFFTGGAGSVLYVDQFSFDYDY